MRRNKFLAGCIAIPSAVYASVCSHSVTSSADDNSLSISEYLVLFWECPKDFLSYYWWYICSMIKGFDEEDVKNAINSCGRIANRASLKNELRTSQFSNFRDLENIKLMTKWYIEIMNPKNEKEAKDNNNFDVFVDHFSAVMEGNSEKFFEQNGEVFDETKFLENISVWAQRKCSGTFRDKLWRTVTKFCQDKEWLYRVRDYVTILTGNNC